MEDWTQIEGHAARGQALWDIIGHVIGLIWWDRRLGCPLVCRPLTAPVYRDRAYDKTCGRGRDLDNRSFLHNGHLKSGPTQYKTTAMSAKATIMCSVLIKGNRSQISVEVLKGGTQDVRPSLFCQK